MSLATAPSPSASLRRNSLLGSLRRPDWLLLLPLFTFLFILCAVRSHHRLFWADELYGFQVLSSPTLAGTLRGWREGADGGGVFYYLLGRLWVSVFGLHELTLRSFSTAGMCAAVLLSWAALRRYFTLAPTAIAVAIVYLTAPILLWQEVNGRFYGLFLASAALASLCFLAANDDVSGSPGPRLLGLTAIAHAALIGSHILGLVYSFALIVATVALGARHRRLRFPLLLAEIAGWCVLPPSLHAIRASSSIATTTFWTQRPSPDMLFMAIAMFGRVTEWVLAAAACLALAATLGRRMRSNTTTEARPFGPFLETAPAALVAAMLLAELILFFKSQHGISIYADRYLLPVTIASVFLLAACLRRIFALSDVLTHRPSRELALSGAAVLLCLVYAANRNVNYALYPPARYVSDIADAIPAGEPVMLTNPAFNLLSRYDPAHNYLFMVNWAFDTALQNAGQDFSGERLMENWRRADYVPGHILSCRELFTRYPDVYLNLDFHRAEWFRQRLEKNPDFQVRFVTHVPDWWPSDIWFIHRVSPGSPPC